MDTLIELALLAGAIYGVRHYFLTPEATQNREVFCSRGATLVKRLVQAKEGLATDGPAAAAASPVVAPAAAEPAVSQADAGAEEAVPAVEVEIAPVVAEPVAVSPAAVASVEPEDSVLKRHYFAQLAAEQSQRQNPYPTDSVLRRHYAQQQQSLLNPAEAVEVKSAPIAAEPVAEAEVAVQPEPAAVAKPAMPQDSVLRRHFIGGLQAELGGRLGATPSDSVLKRHHSQRVQAELEACLAELD